MILTASLQAKRFLPCNETQNNSKEKGYTFKGKNSVFFYLFTLVNMDLLSKEQISSLGMEKFFPFLLCRPLYQKFQKFFPFDKNYQMYTISLIHVLLKLIYLKNKKKTKQTKKKQVIPHKNYNDDKWGHNSWRFVLKWNSSLSNSLSILYPYPILYSYSC